MKHRRTGSGEMLEKNQIIMLFGAFGFISAPAAWACPHIVITSHKDYQTVNGGQGYIPHGLPPTLGERGGHHRNFFSFAKR